MGHTNIESLGLTSDDAASINQNRSNEIVSGRAYMQLVHSDFGLPEYIEKCKKVTAVCNLVQPITHVFGMQSSLGLTKKYMRSTSMLENW